MRSERLAAAQSRIALREPVVVRHTAPLSADVKDPRVLKKEDLPEYLWERPRHYKNYVKEKRERRQQQEAGAGDGSS